MGPLLALLVLVLPTSGVAAETAVPVGGVGALAAAPAADTTSPLERAYERLEAGEPEEARQGLMEEASEATGSRATLLLRVVTILDRVEGPAASAALGAALAVEEDERDRALGILEEGVEDVGEEERPVLLGFAAEIADRQDVERAAALRTRLLEEHPESLEAPEAGLRLARHRARSLEGLEEAETILEEILVSLPNHPLAPEARRELERVRERLNGTGGER